MKKNLLVFIGFLLVFNSCTTEAEMKHKERMQLLEYYDELIETRSRVETRKMELILDSLIIENDSIIQIY